MYWEKYSHQKIKHQVLDALSKNANYNTETILGLPGTLLDSEVFYEDAPFLNDAPFLSTFIANPNHIGVHTLGDEHEDFFKGTHEIERDLIKICAEEILGANPLSYDGYVASGGTEANIEALWIYRNFFMTEYKAAADDVAVIYSTDTHYSIPKAIDLLGLRGIPVGVDEETREIKMRELEQLIIHAKDLGYKYYIVNLNMSTTMFGSVDDLEKITNLLNFFHLNYKIHVDAAYGGFIYPFTNDENPYTFRNKNISSFSIDGHKMLQAPYGTGIFVIRKEFMKYVCTNEAGYVKGKDFTLCGSRSGANAICVWMILRTHGSIGWHVKMNKLIDHTHSLCAKLDELNIKYFNNPLINIVAIKAGQIPDQIAQKYRLVPDNHHDPKWYKIVVMPHVTAGVIDQFIYELRLECTKHLI